MPETIMTCVTQYQACSHAAAYRERQRCDEICCVQALLDEGKVKAIGVSEGTVDQIRTIHSIVPVSVLEEEWSLFSREVEVEALSPATAALLSQHRPRI